MCFALKWAKIEFPESWNSTKNVDFGGSWAIVFNTKINVKTQEEALNVREVSLGKPDAVMLLVFNTNNTVFS